MEIRHIDCIKKGIYAQEKISRNFPKSVERLFDPLYLEMVTQIRTIELSSECILFDSVEAVNTNKAFHDLDYWNKGYTSQDIREYWFFSANGQGDLWLFNDQNKVYFYDHNLAVFCKENFVFLDVDFSKWLQFADIQQQFEQLDGIDALTETIKKTYQNMLTQLSNALGHNYPFEI